jgi:lysozyme family protein
MLTGEDNVMATTSDFQRAFELVIGHEGGYTDNPNDPGNWTGGAKGQGTCKGTKYGISAASYPNLDIKNLTLGDAQAIYARDYWIKAGCPDAPPRLAFALFDAAINNGVGNAVRWLQGAIGAAQDGAYGPQTKAALERASTRDPEDLDLIQEIHAQRIFFMAGLKDWKNFGLGWARRLAGVPLQAGHHWPKAA